MLKLEHNLGADRDCTLTKFKGAQPRDRDFENRQKVDNFKPVYLGNYEY